MAPRKSPLDSQSALFVQALRAGLNGNPDRMHAELAQVLRRPPTALATNPALLEGLHAAVATNKTTRGTAKFTTLPPTVLPSDAPSCITTLDVKDVITPAFDTGTTDALNNIVSEHRSEYLKAQGIPPTRALLLTGAPGTGKTAAARWLAAQLDKPLLALDIATVMTKELGGSGKNLAAAIEYTSHAEAVLFIDEFDAIASARSSSSDIGEVRRIVNVLLIALDNWPADHLLIAATNFPELLDPAIRRRFEVAITVPKPDQQARQRIWSIYLPMLPKTETGKLATESDGWTGSDIATQALRIRRTAGLRGRQPNIDDARAHLKDHRPAPQADQHDNGVSLSEV